MIPLSDYDRGRSVALRRARRRATGLLAAVAALFVATFAMGEATWVGFVRSAAEAAVIGGLADWFAVTALFRHPLGLPIPHTAIIPRSKTGLARSLSQFVEHNFLAPEQVLERLEASKPLEKAGRWLREGTNSAWLAGHVVRIARELIRESAGRQLAMGLEETARMAIREIGLSQMLGRTLRVTVTERRHRPLVDAGLQAVEEMIRDQEDTFRRRLVREAPWWVPVAINDAIFDRAYNSLLEFLEEVRSNPDHEMRRVLDERLAEYATRLEDDPDLADRVTALAEEMIADKELGRTVGDFLDRLLHENGFATPQLTRWLTALGSRLSEDPHLQDRIYSWMGTVTPSLARVAQRELADLISITIERWNPEDTSRRLELWMGRDLQFVRINGTVVGGLAGLAIHTAVYLAAGG